MPYPNHNRQNYRMRPNNVPPPTKNPYLSQQELRKKALEYNAGQLLAQGDGSSNVNQDMRNQMNQMDHRNQSMQRNQMDQRNQQSRRVAPQNMLSNTNNSASENEPPLPTETVNWQDRQMTSDMDDSMNMGMTTTDDNDMTTTDDNNMTTRRSNGMITRYQTRTTRNMNVSPTKGDWANSSTRSWMNTYEDAPMNSMQGNDADDTLTPRSNPFDENRSFPWMNPRGDERLSPSTTKDLPNRPPWLKNRQSNRMRASMDMDNNEMIQSEDTALDFLPRTERENEEYMKMIRRHPEDVRRIYTEVKNAFDRLSYNGSWIYDENPDRATLLRLSEDIYRSLLPITEDYDPSTDNPDQAEEENRTPGLLSNKTSPRWMLYVIFILVQNELMHRRA